MEAKVTKIEWSDNIGGFLTTFYTEKTPEYKIFQTVSISGDNNKTNQLLKEAVELLNRCCVEGIGIRKNHHNKDLTENVMKFINDANKSGAY